MGFGDFLLGAADFLLGPLYDRPSSNKGPSSLELAYQQQQPEMPDFSGMYEAMLEGFGQQMEMMTAMQANAMAQQLAILQQYSQNMMSPSMLAIPEAKKTEPIDFGETVAKLNSRARADQSLAAMRRKGVSDTIHTSSLLDEEEADVTASPLGRG